MVINDDKALQLHPISEYLAAQSSSRGVLPNPMNVINAFKDFLLSPLAIAEVAGKGMWELIKIVWKTLVAWIVDAVPVSNWQRADRWVANLTLVIFGASYAGRLAMKGVGFGDWVDSVSLDAKKATEIYTTTLLFRVVWGIVGPWLGGFIALILVFPEFLLNLALSFPQLIIDLTIAVFNWLIDVLNEIVKQVIKAVVDLIKALVDELVKPFKAILDLLKKISGGIL